MATAQAKKPTGSVPETGKPPYPFRTIISLILLGGNILIAAIYFHVVNP